MVEGYDNDIQMIPDQHLKRLLTLSGIFCTDEFIDEIKSAIRKDQDEEHTFCKEVIKAKIEGKNVEGSTFKT